ncbi:MAG: hypothetical protein WD042_16175 [Phycisphaeraceae bacterium]
MSDTDNSHPPAPRRPRASPPEIDSGPAPTPGQDVPRPDGSRQLVLVKEGRRYAFTYTPGQEGDVLSGLVQLANDPASSFSWFDAALLCHQMGQRMSERLAKLRRA